jgi:diguanylate cyclase (GGDEF)-like protein/PAS domain S-box-containing protein
MPWAVLLMVLGLTASYALFESRSISEGQNAALESTEGHFRDVVKDNENRAQLVSEAYNRVLAGAIYGLKSPVDPALVATRLDILLPDVLPGSEMFFVVPSGGEPVKIRGRQQPSAKMRISDSAPPGLWVGIPNPDQNIVVIGYTTVSGDSLVALADVERLLDLVMTSSEHGHGVDVSLRLLSRPDASPVMIDGDVTFMDDDHSIDDRDSASDSPVASHLHDGMSHVHDGSETFHASLEPIIFGQPWALDIMTDPDFLTIPANHEVRQVMALGVLLSLVSFGLIHFLVRRMTAETQRIAAEERFKAGFESSPIGVAILDTSGRILEMNESLERLLGRSALDLAGTPMADLVAEPLRVPWMARVLLTDSETSRPRAEVRYEPESDRSFWVDETVAFVVANDGDRRILLQMSDITEQCDAREELQRMVLHDKLTGLANRTLLEDRLQQALRRSQRDGSIAAVMFIDVDHFKTVNDTLGHGVGDQLLTELADRLKTITRGEDTIARFGGDEFVMLCERLSNQNEIWQIAERIRTQIATPFEVGNRPIPVTVSIGIALCGPDDDAEALLRDSDLAMYQAKELGRDRVILFEREMRDDLSQQLELERQLINALKEGELELYYQPVIRLDDNNITGFEALSRWNHPKRGVLPPGDFLPAAAQLGLLPTIDAWALDTAVHQLVAWTKELPEASNWAVAVNAAAGNFDNPEFPTIVTETITRSGLDPQRVTIELTEQAILASTDTAFDVIKQLQQLGVRVAIDDFGTGYSSLSQLAALDVDILKIDKSQVDGIAQSPFNEIVRAVVDLARSLGIRTVAEGVETNEHLTLLRQIGADDAQGYLISRPIPADQVPTFTATQLEPPSVS